MDLEMDFGVIDLLKVVRLLDRRKLIFIHVNCQIHVRYNYLLICVRVRLFYFFPLVF